MCETERNYFYNGRINSRALLVRETIAENAPKYTSNYYNKSFNTTVTRVNIFNFGEDKAFVKQITITNRDTSSYVTATIEFQSETFPKLFVEVYGITNTNRY